MDLQNLKELLSSPGWSEYREQLEEVTYNLFVTMLDLEPSNPQSYIKFLQLKSQIDMIRDMTYIIENQLAQGTPERLELVNSTYQGIFRRLSNRLFKRS